MKGEIVRLANNLSLLQKKGVESTTAAPLYIHSFRFITPKTVLEAQKFALKSPTADKFETVADKLRYYRHKKGLWQADVADCIGIERSTYIEYENPDRYYYPAKVMEKLAELFDVDIYDLLDDYNKFLYEGQGENIRKLRLCLNITQAELAEKMSVTALHIRRWEKDEIRMHKSTWDKLKKLLK